MELVLNLVWALLGLVITALWLLLAPRTGVSRKAQLVTLAVLILILFPVISVTDDLMATQNPAEADCCLRKDHVVSFAHSIFPAVAGSPQPAIEEPSVGSVRLAAPCKLPSPTVDHPAMAAIQNRPPPVA